VPLVGEPRTREQGQPMRETLMLTAARAKIKKRETLKQNFRRDLAKIERLRGA
jgi:hypothetical protein